MLSIISVIEPLLLFSVYRKIGGIKIQDQFIRRIIKAFKKYLA